MARKINAVFNVSLAKNKVKGGAWMATYIVAHEASDGYMPVKTDSTAWATAAAGKRWLKEMTQANTPKRSVKFIPGDEKDAKGKPVWFAGSLSFKQEV